MNPTASPPITDVPEQIAKLIWVLCEVVTQRFSPRVRTLTKEQVEYIVNRVLLPARERFRRVVERIRAGKPPKPRARKPRPRRVKPPKPVPMAAAEINQGFKPPRGWQRWAREDRARERAAKRAAREMEARVRAAENKPVPLWRALRQHLSGWLCGCAPAIYQYPGSAPSCANEMRRLLAEPEMRALLMSNRCVGDSLRKVCWGLKVERSLLYPEPTPEPDATIATSADIVSATPQVAAPPAAAVVTAEEDQFFGAASLPFRLTAPGAMPSSRTSPGARVKDHFFTPD